MNQFFTALKNDTSSQFALVAAFLLLVMAAYAAIKNLKRKRAKKKEIEAKTKTLTTEAQRLLAVNATSQLEDRRQLQKELDSFRKLSTNLGMDPDAFIALEQQNAMRQLARTAKDELGLSDAKADLAPDAPSLEFFAEPIPFRNDLTLFTPERDTDVMEEPAEEQEDSTGRFDRPLIDDDSPTRPFERNSLAPAAAEKKMSEINADFDRLMSYSEDSEGVIYLEDLDDTETEPARP